MNMEGFIDEYKKNQNEKEVSDYNYNIYKKIYKESMEEPEKFWTKIASELIDWFKPWYQVFKQDGYLTKWFIGGELNASYNAVDRHLNSPRKYKAAIIWESEIGERRSITYQELFYEVNKWSNALKQLGVTKGDRVTIYMPLTPEGIIAMLATVRIGAIHSVVFAGFGAQALADRILDAESKVIITADGFYRRGKLVELKKTVDEALKILGDKSPVKNVIIWRRLGIEVSFNEKRDIEFEKIGKYKYIEPVSVEATHPLYILYTSGTTGKPKGIVHSTGGYLVGTAYMGILTYGLDDEDSALYNTSDIGWVVGHSYITYAPLVLGRTVIIYESAPDYPYPSKWAEIIEKYRATAFGTSATALRYMMRYGENIIKDYDLSSLKVIITNGEPLNFAPWKFGLEVIGRGNVYMSHQWWQTETGAPNIGYMPGLIYLRMKPGPVCGLPLPGNRVKVYTDSGNEASPNEKGYLVLLPPYPPSMMIGMWNDANSERLYKSYFAKFKDVYYTGDFAYYDEDGYITVSGRADETIKVAGHRIGAGELESIITSHPAVAEAGVVGIPDPVKGESIHAFVVLKLGFEKSESLAKDIQEHVKRNMGPIAVPTIHFISKLPKTRSGKVMRRVIKAVLLGNPIGDLSTLEDEASMEEIKKVIEEMKKEVNKL